MFKNPEQQLIEAQQRIAELETALKVRGPLTVDAEKAVRKDERDAFAALLYDAGNENRNDSAIVSVLWGVRNKLRERN